MNVEIWDLYDAQGEKTGKTMIRGEAIPIGFYHIGVHIWPMNDKGELLIQRRSMGVQWKPGIWAVTGGSAVSGEEPLDRRDDVSCGKNWAMPLPKQTKCSLSPDFVVLIPIVMSTLSKPTGLKMISRFRRKKSALCAGVRPSGLMQMVCRGQHV